MFEEKVVATYPADLSNPVDNEDSVATTKEEEWVTKKKTDIITTRQIETRVKRQLVVEDGKIVEDSGPLVTTNTTEDTEKQESSQTEHKNLGDDNSTEKWVEVSNPTGCVKEVEEKTVRSRQETEERVETENVKHLGDISDEGYMTVIKSGSDDFRQALEVSNQKGLVETLPKIVHQSQKVKKYIDTEDRVEHSSIQPGGKIINETKTTRLHEELGDYNLSDDDDLSDPNLCDRAKKENYQRYRKTKEQDITEYLADGQKIGEKLHYQTEHSEGERRGDFFDHDDNVSNISSKLKRIKMRARTRGPELKDDDSYYKRSSPAQNLDPEEEAKKAETSKWLEHHFGSESTKSSNGSYEDFEDIIPSTQNSFISVTMKSQPLKKTSTPRRFLTSFDEDDATDYKFSRSNDHSHRVQERYERKDNEYLVSQSPQSFSNYDNHFQNSVGRSSPRIYNSSPLTINEVNYKPTRKVEPYQKFQTITDLQKSERVPIGKTGIKVLPDRKQTYSPYQYNEVNTKHDYLSSSSNEVKPTNDSRNITRVNSTSMELLKNKEPYSKPKADGYRSPTLRDTNTPVDIPKKKVYQRTRFAADIPLSPQPNQAPPKQKNKIGESFRRLMSKLRSGSEGKSKKRLNSRGSRSPSPNENTYENYNSIDSYEPFVSKIEKDANEPVAPLRAKYVSGLNSHPPEKKERLMQRYYLGEDPFSSSIYGREKEYEQNNDKNQKTWDGKGSKSDVIKDFKARTLGRFSKSTSRLTNAEKFPQNNLYDRGGIKTLPRKFLDETGRKKPVTVSNATKNSPPDESYLQEANRMYYSKEPIFHTNSMINVSFVNKPQDSARPNEKSKYLANELCGPAKPARTYRSKLSRSHSFNIQPGENSFVEMYNSNPHFRRLDESPPPLKSPSIISGWSQNSGYNNEKKRQWPETNAGRGNLFASPEPFKPRYDRNVTDNINKNFQSDDRTRQKYVNYSSSFRSASSINTNSGGEDQQKRFIQPNYSKPFRIPVNRKPYDDYDSSHMFSRSEDSGSEYAAIPRRKYPLSTATLFPEKMLSSNNLADWKRPGRVTNNRMTSDYNINNNSKGVVIKVVNCKN